MALNLPTLAEVQASRKGPLLKGKSRLEAKVEAKPLTVITERAFKSEVWTRDRKRCRCCGRKVLKTLSRVPERGEVHHVHGRVGALEFEARAALLVCLTCHERVTGKVNDKLVIVGTRLFTLKSEKTGIPERYIDARKPVHFRETT